jgi:hypothetical protein
MIEQNLKVIVECLVIIVDGLKKANYFAPASFFESMLTEIDSLQHIKDGNFISMLIKDISPTLRLMNELPKIDSETKNAWYKVLSMSIELEKLLEINNSNP